jgi:thymidine phosphorylase
MSSKKDNPRPAGAHAAGSILRARRLGLDTQDEMVVFMHKECPVCRAEGFRANARVQLNHAEHSIVATLYPVSSDLLALDEAGLSDSAWNRLNAKEGAKISVSHPPPLLSFGAIRGKVYGRRLSQDALRETITDIVAGQYSDIQLSSFITACSARPLDRPEMIALTRAMIDIGEQLDWDRLPIVDKHSVGGLPGNRTTPIIVAIAAACGLTMPKTSSRAITSPAGTADTMETMAPVDLDTPAMRRVVEQEGGCVVWGGAIRLSPADDILIRIERALDLDAEGQLVASVLSKKIAAGSTHLVLDLPVGSTAKIRSTEAAERLSGLLVDIAAEFGLSARAVVSDGSQPIGRGIGPALEARDVMAVLQGTPEAPADLRQRAATLAGTLLELAGAAPPGGGAALAAATLSSGAAWTKFQRICDAQGGMREPPASAHRRPVVAERAGRVGAIDNRRLAQSAKLAGAPDAKAAGVEMHVRLGQRVEPAQPLFTMHAETPGELAYAMAYLSSNPDIIRVEIA